MKDNVSFGHTDEGNEAREEVEWMGGSRGKGARRLEALGDSDRDRFWAATDSIPTHILDLNR